MASKNRNRVLGQPYLIVRHVGLVSAANFHESAPALPHDVWHTERAADLDHLSSRENHVHAIAKRRKSKQDTCRRVVDHKRIFRASETTEKLANMGLPVTAASALQIKLNRRMAPRDRCDMLCHARRQTRPPQTGVENNA